MKDGDIVVCINDDYKGYKFILNKSYTVTK